MCWFAHELEPYALKHIFKQRLSIIWIMIGSFSPDFFTKIFIQFEIIPVYQHRHVGLGITHTPFYGLILGLIAYLVVRHLSNPKYAKIVLISFVIGQWSHVLFDSFDTSGCMWFFPFSTELYSFGIWQYGAQLHFWGDLYVFFHSPALIIEAFWLVYVWFFGWKMITNEYFEKEIYINEKLWWICNKFGAWKTEAKIFFRVMYTFFFVGGLRLLIWVTYVWNIYDPTPEAESLASNNVGYSFFNNYLVYIFAMIIMLSIVVYATWRWWKRVERKFYVLPFSTLGALLLVSFIPNEAISSIASHITILIACTVGIIIWKI